MAAGERMEVIATSCVASVMAPSVKVPFPARKFLFIGLFAKFLLTRLIFISHLTTSTHMVLFSFPPVIKKEGCLTHILCIVYVFYHLWHCF